MKLSRFFLPLGVFCLLLLDFYLRSRLESVSRVCNAGIAFGIHIPAELLLALSLLLILGFFSLWLRAQQPLLETGFLLIFMGGGANFVDRIVFGCVRDYIQLPFLPVFPSFNMADIVLSLGVGCLALGFFRDARPSSD